MISLIRRKQTCYQQSFKILMMIKMILKNQKIKMIHMMVMVLKNLLISQKQLKLLCYLLKKKEKITLILQLWWNLMVVLTTISKMMIMEMKMTMEKEVTNKIKLKNRTKLFSSKRQKLPHFNLNWKKLFSNLLKNNLNPLLMKHLKKQNKLQLLRIKRILKKLINWIFKLQS